MAETNIRIDGVKETIKTLNAFEPDLKKAMTKEIRQSLNVVKNRAKGKYPNGAWTVRINNRNILGSVIATGGGNNWDGRWSEISPGVRAAIFEFAGSVQSGRTPQAAGLIKSLNARYGQPGRFLWSAWDEVGPGVLENIKDAVLRAERDLQASLDAAGEGY